MWYGPDHGGHWLMMGILQLVFWLIVVVAIVALVRYRRADNTHDVHSARTNSAQRLLAERFARGEIDEAEFKHRLDVLRAHGSVTNKDPSL